METKLGTFLSSELFLRGLSRHMHKGLICDVSIRELESDEEGKSENSILPIHLHVPLCSLTESVLPPPPNLHPLPLHTSASAPSFYNNNNNRIQRHYSRFFTISSQHRELSPTRTLKWPGRNRVQITCNTSSAYHMQVSCYVPPGTKGQLSIKFDRVEIAFI